MRKRHEIHQIQQVYSSFVFMLIQHSYSCENFIKPQYPISEMARQKLYSNILSRNRGLVEMQKVNISYNFSYDCNMKIHG